MGFQIKLSHLYQCLMFLFSWENSKLFSSFCFSSNIPSTTNFHILLLLLLHHQLPYSSPPPPLQRLGLDRGMERPLAGITKRCLASIESLLRYSLCFCAFTKKKLRLILMCRLCSDSESENLQRLFMPYDLICDRSVNAQWRSWLALESIFFQFMGFPKVQKMAWRWFGRFSDFPQQTSARAGTVAPVWLPRKVLPLAILAMRQTIPQMFGVRELDLIPPHFFLIVPYELEHFSGKLYRCV